MEAQHSIPVTIEDVQSCLEIVEIALQTDGFIDSRVEAEARPAMEALYERLRAALRNQP